MGISLPPDLEHCTQDIDGERISIEYRCTRFNALPSNISGSPVATFRKFRDQIGALIEADSRPITFIVFEGCT